jgi:hypothetical protein
MAATGSKEDPIVISDEADGDGAGGPETFRLDADEDVIDKSIIDADGEDDVAESTITVVSSTTRIRVLEQ